MDAAFQRAIRQKPAEIKYVTVLDAAIPLLESNRPWAPQHQHSDIRCRRPRGLMCACADVHCRDLCVQQGGLAMRALLHPLGGSEAAVKMNEAGLWELTWEDLQDIW